MATTSVRSLFTKLKILGTGDSRLAISNNQLHALLQFSCNDLHWHIESDLELPAIILPTASYYRTKVSWFNKLGEAIEVSNNDILNAIQLGLEKDGDFGLFINNLAMLHKRRLKYQRITHQQQRPTMEQVGARSLLEYGFAEDELLSSWLIWRKWIFDIDNRSGQETGYLFEPLLANCLGGVSVAAKNSPVRRLNADGSSSERGRQVDCYVAADGSAYEFKLRVTAAASGQGRFAEEISFPAECRAAGIVPILLVLDPTPSERLKNLVKAFASSGGYALIGEDAWKHVEQKAGKTMSVFIATYVRPPLERMSALDSGKPEKISLRQEGGKIVVEGTKDKYVIRQEEQ